MKQFRFVGIRTLISVLLVQRSANEANTPTGRWSLNWIVIYPQERKVEMMNNLIMFWSCLHSDQLQKFDVFQLMQKCHVC